MKVWTDDAWEDYLYWQKQDKKTLKRINQLIRDIDRNGYTGIGKPEPLRGNLSGYWSRRIDGANRIVYQIAENTIRIVQCGSHYRDDDTADIDREQRDTARNIHFSEREQYRPQHRIHQNVRKRFFAQPEH